MTPLHKKNKELLNTFRKEKIQISFNRVLSYLIDNDYDVSTIDVWNNVDEIIKKIKDIFGVESKTVYIRNSIGLLHVAFEFNLNDEDYLPKDLLKHRP